MLPQDRSGAARVRTWFDAWVESAYGADGFWRRHWPGEHFRTASTSGSMIAEPLVAALDRYGGGETVIDVGAGRGELLSALARMRPKLRLGGIDLRPRPDRLPEGIRWAADLWDVRYAGWTTGQAETLLQESGPVLLVCCEWLDDLPCRVVHREADGWREAVVDDSGEQRPGPRLVNADLDWADRWWPNGQRAEIGVNRDRAWSAMAAVVRQRQGCAVMIDYGHRRSERPPNGSFAAYRDGRSVEPMPSAELNLTAHVSIDSVRAAGEAAGLTTELCCRQGEAVARLGSQTPPDPDALVELSRRSERAALSSPYGWGSHWWLVQRS
ncbi:MAG TPA: SAM-dependent methyltransferase [Propionibacteriaceae bacterium]|nr:SAM-dependent methyltransferase [Propionibacteriaceae bacterium]